MKDTPNAQQSNGAKPKASKKVNQLNETSNKKQHDQKSSHQAKSMRNLLGEQ